MVVTRSGTTGRVFTNGGDRAQWTAYADRLLDAAARWASPGGARISPPSVDGEVPTPVDGLEGFARTFLLAGFRIVGDQGHGLDELIARYRRGIITGVDPSAPDRWVRIDEHPQAKVEAASIALVLDMTREWIWDELDERTRQRVIDYLSPVVGDDTYPKTNWVWFRIVVETFLRSVGGPWSADDIAADLDRHDSFAHADGWVSDGYERAYDHYVGWALHLYPVLWARMRGADQLAGGRAGRDAYALDRYLQDAVHLVGGDGSPLIQGRSLIYRFAAAAPFWLGVIAETPSVSAGLLRSSAAAIVGHFAAQGVPDSEGALGLGWHDEWPRLAQSYSGVASPYWAVKGLLGVALPADHPIWAVPSEPVAVLRADELRVVRAPGWIISGTAEDGVVRVINHGTDHAAAGSLGGDSPLYARIGYSTAAAPLLDDDAWAVPVEQSVVLVDAAGRATHRAGMELLDLRREGDSAIAASVALAHWIDPAPDQIGHGSGLAGRVERAGRIVTHSIVHGAWEVRIVRILGLEPAARAQPLQLRVGGWALAAETAPVAIDDGVGVDELWSRIVSLGGVELAPGLERRRGASPLGDYAAVPFLIAPAERGTTYAVGVGLGTIGALERMPAVRLDGEEFEVRWPDGAVVRSTLTRAR